MARKRSPDRDKAFELWKSSSGSMKLIDIAKELGCKPSQIRKWKSQDKWDDQLKGTVTKPKGTLPKTNSNVTNQKERKVTEEKQIELDDPLNELNAQQRMFCREYLLDLNKTQAAIRAGYSEKTARQQGARLFTNANIQAYIQKLMNDRVKRVDINADDLLKALHKSAFADMKEYVEWGVHEVTVYNEYGDVVYDSNGNPAKVEMPYLRLKDMDEIDGKDISEIKMGRNGIEFKRVDPLKSRELLGRHLKLFTDKHELSGNVTFEQLLEEMDDG